MSKLYLDHFGLRTSPFDLTPNPDFFFTGGQRGELLEAIAFAALDAPGIVLVIGEVGSGKTMLCRMLAQRIQQLGHDLIYLDNPSFGPQEILHTVAHDWGLPLDNNLPLQWQLQQHLLARHRQARQVVLLIDEAQAMSAASLEEIRLLSNLENATHKLLRIVLFGQPELDDKLRTPELRQLRDRIVHRFDIDPIAVSEAQHYLYHRLHCAGSQGRRILSEQAALRIAQASRGRLRSLHHLAERALLAAYTQGSPSVEPNHVRQAEQDLARTGIEIPTPRKPPPGLGTATRRSTMVLGGALAGAVLAGLALTMFQPEDAVPQPSPSQALPATQAADSEPPPPPTTASAPPPAQPSQPVRASPVQAPSWDEWLQRGQRMLDDAQLGGFTIQLLTGTDAKAIERLLATEPAIAEQAWVLPRLYPPGQPRQVWALFWGHHALRQESLARLRELPPAWQRFQPQIRSLAALRAEPRPGAPAPAAASPASP